MNPYYLADLQAGILDRAEALELVECFFLKAMELNKVRDWGSTEFNTGYAMYQTLTIGGQDGDGRDATNEMTYLVLEATADLKVQEPTTVLRVHDGTPDELWMAAVETLAEHKGGLPSFFNDVVALEILLRHKHNEISLTDARNWAVMGCVEPTVPGRFINSTGGTCTINLAKAFEVAFNNGVNPETNVCVFEPEIREIDSCGDLLQAFEEQLAYYLDLVPLLMHATCEAYQELTPTPFLSALTADRVELAQDLMEGKTERDYNVELIEIHGLGTVTDAIAAVKSAVFDQDAFTIQELHEMIDADFVGYRRERLFLQNKVPKYGNDEEEVDVIAKRIVNWVADYLAQYVTPRGGCYGLSTQTTTSNVPDGKAVGATPNGRLTGKPLSDNHSPSPGADRSGPTAAMRSVARTDHQRVGMGTLFNMRFTPAQFQTKPGREKFIDLIKGYFALGGYQVQFNVVSNETLLAAQENPTEYRDLIVKVAGYSARFTDLDRQLQDQLIQRTRYGV